MDKDPDTDLDIIVEDSKILKGKVQIRLEYTDTTSSSMMLYRDELLLLKDKIDKYLKES